jgi:hypothetical protein
LQALRRGFETYGVDTYWGDPYLEFPGKHEVVLIGLLADQADDAMKMARLKAKVQRAPEPPASPLTAMDTDGSNA